MRHILALFLFDAEIYATADNKHLITMRARGLWCIEQSTLSMTNSKYIHIGRAELSIHFLFTLCVHLLVLVLCICYAVVCKRASSSSSLLLGVITYRYRERLR